MRTHARRKFCTGVWLPSAFTVLLSAGLLWAGLGVAREVVTTEVLLQAVRQTGGPAGICLHVGAGEGQLTAELAKSERLAVHAFARTGPQAQKARALLDKRGVYGQAVFEEWDAPFLPVADNLINLVIAEDPGATPETELLRVLAPLGVLWLKRGNGWDSITKPWPREFDEWTHWRHGADGNMVSRDAAVATPSGVRWVAGPAQDSGGRKYYYDHVLVSAGGRNFYLFEDGIIARDAFNGRLLWTRQAKAYVFRESGTMIAQKLATRTSKVRPVAVGDRLYAAMEGQLLALDAATGETVQVLANLVAPREIAVLDDFVLLTDQQGIRAFERKGKLAWEKGEAARRLVAGDAKVFYLTGSNVVCLELRSGRELWRTLEPKAAEAVTCSYFQGGLVLERSSWKDDGIGSGVVVFSGETGKLLWQHDYIPGMTHWKEARAFFADDLVWIEAQPERKGQPMQFMGFDPRTGEKKRQVGTRGLHCSVPIATEQYFIASELEFTDIKSGERSRARMVKGACRLPFTPANGLLYTFPVQCECFPMLRGYMGLAQTPPPHPVNQPRLQRGPAFETAENVSAHNSATDWPMYRRDVFRSGSTPEEIDTAQIKQLWAKPVGAPRRGTIGADWEDNPFVNGPVTPPVCAGGLVLAAAPDQHRVTALDAATGNTRWTFTAGGRVDTPPSITGDRCVFGAHDGYLYCVRLADGQLAWRLRAAPYETRIAAYGQLESPWPVTGSVLVEDGKAYAAAGRHPNADGGLRVLAVRVSNGELLWEQSITDTGVTNWYASMLAGTRQKVGVDYDPVDLLVRDGDTVAMSRWQFDRANGAMNLQFDRTNYLAFGTLEVPRGAWGYGIRQTKLVLDKPPIAFTGQEVARGATNETALLLAGTAVIRAQDNGTLLLGDQTLKLEAPVVRDGLIVSGGRLYVATQEGKVYCFGKE